MEITQEEDKEIQRIYIRLKTMGDFQERKTDLGIVTGNSPRYLLLHWTTERFDDKKPWFMEQDGAGLFTAEDGSWILRTDNLSEVEDRVKEIVA